MFFAKQPEVLDWNEFMGGRAVVKPRLSKMDEKMIETYVKRKKLIKTVIKVGVLAVAVYSAIPIPMGTVSAATAMVSAAASTATAPGHAWDNLINGLLNLLDPAAKIFGVIAGLAIMTGNGKIGLERLFWLSLGYITARKVEVWIEFLNTI